MSLFRSLKQALDEAMAQDSSLSVWSGVVVPSKFEAHAMIITGAVSAACTKLIHQVNLVSRFTKKSSESFSLYRLAKPLASSRCKIANAYHSLLNLLSMRASAICLLQ